MSDQQSPLSYATPVPRSLRRVWWLVILVVVLTVLVGLVAVLLSWQRVTVVVTKPPGAAATPKKVVPPTVPSRVTIVQRGEQPLPGSKRTIVARIGDITGGQVLLWIDDANERALLQTVSVREGDIHSFAVSSANFEIECVQLKNFLTGDDFAVFALRRAGTALSEEEKIQRLIDAVASAPGVTFIRNDQPHTSADAAAHLNRKYQAAKGRAPTAREFIEHVASRSSVSGEEYRVRLADGSEQTSEQWLMTKLREIEAPEARRWLVDQILEQK